MLGLGGVTHWLALRKGRFMMAPVVTGAMRCCVFEIREDDVSGAEILALLAFHLERMHALSPPDSVFALDFSGLRAPGVTLWSAWYGTAIAGMGALKLLGDGAGEIKSMRTHPDYLRRGVGGMLLDHIMSEARRCGLRRLSLETGRGPGFEPALALYRKRGFVDGAAFADYGYNDFSQFLHLDLT